MPTTITLGTLGLHIYARGASPWVPSFLAASRVPSALLRSNLCYLQVGGLHKLTTWTSSLYSFVSGMKSVSFGRCRAVRSNGTILRVSRMALKYAEPSPGIEWVRVTPPIEMYTHHPGLTGIFDQNITKPGTDLPPIWISVSSPFIVHICHSVFFVLTGQEVGIPAAGCIAWNSSRGMQVSLMDEESIFVRFLRSQPFHYRIASPLS